ncbi:MAG: HEAT repeat domain-containing protein [Bythopirellula sp.]|nr:HEAT repeat domain-containing protein [Bythopirellula sp.]
MSLMVSAFSRILGSITCLALLIAATGCASLPFQDKERTSIITPAMRIAAIREAGARARDTDATEQARSVDELVAQIRTERDPLVRRAIQESMAEYQTPLARNVLIAGLKDDDLDVKLTCCRKLGMRGEPETVAALRGVLESAEELDLRLAATDALGQINTPESIEALSLAVKDRDPALQFAGVEALKVLSGQDLGNDVKAWQQFTEQGPAVAEPKTSVADKVRQYSPF